MAFELAVDKSIKHIHKFLSPAFVVMWYLKCCTSSGRDVL